MIIDGKKTAEKLREDLKKKIVNKTNQTEIQNDKLKDMKISKPLPELDLRKYQNGKTWKRRADDKKENNSGG